MSLRKYESGAVKRKKAAERKLKEESVIKQTARIETFFTHTVSDSVASSSSADIEKTSVPVEHQEAQLHNQHATDDVNKQPYGHEEVSLTIENNGNTSSGLYETDLGLWKEVSSDMQAHFVSVGSVDCQHKDDDFARSKRSYADQYRYCTAALFTRVHSLTGEKSVRTWLCYSPTTGKVYCFTCKLLSTEASEFSRGFNDWKNVKRAIDSHEKSQTHLLASVAFKQRSSLMGCVDAMNEKLLISETNYWLSVLQRSVDVIKFLAERGLPFRGHEEMFGSPRNGNYMGILELVGKYDSFLATHIEKYGNPGYGMKSYLSSTICDELICVMGNKVLSVIVQELKMAKYYSICIDSTPDISHVDQLSIVARYVQEDGPVERFLSFIDIETHTGRGLATVLLDFLRTNKIDISDCRGQSYDNASNMSGTYNGVQAHILSVNPLAAYIPCFAHSLNLVGANAVDCCPLTVQFFDVVQRVYTFFAASTHRWSILVSALDKQAPVPKKLSDTRWSCHADATSALRKGFKRVLYALEHITGDPEEKQITRQEANGLSSEFHKLETGILITLWDTVLQRFNNTSKALQCATLDLNNAVSLLNSLQDFVSSLRSEFDYFEEQGKELSETNTYEEDTRRKRKRKKQFDESSSGETEMSGKDKFRVEVFLRIIDQLNTALVHRASAYEDISSKFGFLSKVMTMDRNSLKHHCDLLVNHYPSDIETSFSDEMIHFASYAAVNIDDFRNRNENQECSTELIIYRMLLQHELKEVFPNVEIAYRLYLCLMVSNCTGERSFSKLKLIKNETRAKMKEQRLNMLSLMCIETSILRKLNFQDVVRDFANQKARKVKFFK